MICNHIGRNGKCCGRPTGHGGKHYVKRSEHGEAKRLAAQRLAIATPEWRANNIAANRRTAKARRIDGQWFGRLRRVYGLTGDQLQEMRVQQRGICPICETRQAICVDHNHDTGKTRALLCRRCNAALGLFDDDSAIITRAAEYLAYHAIAHHQVEPRVAHG